MVATGGFIKKESLIDFGDKYRRWVQCPECKIIFEVWAKDIWCLKCGYKNNNTEQ